MDRALLRHYANFAGRARRLEYWLFVLVIVAVAIMLSVADARFGLEWILRRAGGILTSIFLSATLLPFVAISFRRLHDTGRSGWWVLAPLALFLLGAIAAEMGAGIVALPVFVAGTIGSIVTLVFCCLPGTPATNRHGTDPKYSPDLEVAD